MKYNEKMKKEDAGMLEQKWYTVADVAALTGLTCRTIRNYLKDGTLHGKKVGVQWRFTEEDIEALFQEAGDPREHTKTRNDLIADFLQGTERTEEMECRILDIPCESEESWNNCLKELRRQNGEERGGWPKIAWEYKKDDKMLRVAIAGKPKDTEWMTKRVRKGLNQNAE